MTESNRHPLEIAIDPRSAVPVYEQVKRAIQRAIVSGQLAGGDPLPSVRELSMRLSVNPNTVLKVYNQLETEGFLRTRPGAGSIVDFDPARGELERRAAFARETDEYLARAASLGFSPAEVREELERRWAEGGDPTRRNGWSASKT